MKHSNLKLIIKLIDRNQQRKFSVASFHMKVYICDKTRHEYLQSKSELPIFTSKCTQITRQNTSSIKYLIKIRSFKTVLHTSILLGINLLNEKFTVKNITTISTTGHHNFQLSYNELLYLKVAYILRLHTPDLHLAIITIYVV
jgi:hypothetical protein